MLARAATNPKSHIILPTFGPPSTLTNPNTKTNTHTSALPNPSWKAAEVDRRTDVGIEIFGAVTSRKGIRRTNVNADRTARSGFGGSVEVSFNWMLLDGCDEIFFIDVERGPTVLFGEAEKKIRGRMRSIAVATDERDSILKERDFPVFVVMG